MDAPLRERPLDVGIATSIHLGTWVLAVVVALAAAAALASFLLLGQTQALPALAEDPPVPWGATPQFDHSVVLRPGLRDEPLEPGASIAAYSTP